MNKNIKDDSNLFPYKTSVVDLALRDISFDTSIDQFSAHHFCVKYTTVIAFMNLRGKNVKKN